MISIINNILSSNGYELVDIELSQEKADIYLFCAEDINKREEYFVTIQLHTQSDSEANILLKEKALEWFENIANSGVVERFFEKNCTMLLCHDEVGIDRETILSLEEDQYNFKKNVVAYDKKEITSLKAYLAENQIKKITNSVINSIINADSGQAFSNFKETHQQKNDHYSLILKIALKLPFITYKAQEQQLGNLLLEVESTLSSPDQLSIYRQLENLDTDWNDENLLYQQVEKIWGNLV